MRSRFSSKKRLPRVSNTQKPLTLSLPPSQSIDGRTPRNHKSLGQRDYEPNVAVSGPHFVVQMTKDGPEVVTQEPTTPRSILGNFESDSNSGWQDIEMHDWEEPNHINSHFSAKYGANKTGYKERRREQNKKQKEKQSHVWLNQILPRLTRIYMDERAGKKGRIRSKRTNNEPQSFQPCTCTSPRLLSVILLHWSCKYPSIPYRSTTLLTCTYWLLQTLRKSQFVSAVDRGWINL